MKAEKELLFVELYPVMGGEGVPLLRACVTYPYPRVPFIPGMPTFLENKI